MQQIQICNPLNAKGTTFHKFLPHGQVHLGQMRKWPWHCTTSGLDNSLELRMEKIRPAVSDICLPQNLEPIACPPERYDNTFPARRSQGWPVKGKDTPFTNFTPHKQTIPTFLRSWQLSCLIKWDVGGIKWICLYKLCPFQILVYWPWKLLYRPCKDNHWVRTTRSNKVSNCTSVLGLYSQNGRTSYHKISWNLEATRLNVMIESVKTSSISWSYRSEILQVTRQSCIEGAFKLHNDRKSLYPILADSRLHEFNRLWSKDINE